MSSYRPYLCTLVERAEHGSYTRITLAGPELQHMTAILDQRVKLLIGDPAALTSLAAQPEWYGPWQQLGENQPIMRTYTVSDICRTNEHTLVSIDVLTRPTHGPGSEFAASAPLGSCALLIGPDSTDPDHGVVGIGWHGQNARDVLLIGDPTALPALRAIAASLAPGVRGEIMAHILSPDDARIEAPAGVTVQWCIGDDSPAVVLDSDPDELFWEEGTPADRYAWVAGEAGWARSLRPLLEERGYTRENSSVMGYWRADS